MVSVVLPTYNERRASASSSPRSSGSLAERASTSRSWSWTTRRRTARRRTSRPSSGPTAAVRVHVRRGERGLASAIYRGIREARGDVIVLMDSDGNHDPVLLPLMVRCVEDFDVVIGSRYVLGRRHAHVAVPLLGLLRLQHPDPRRARPAHPRQPLGLPRLPAVAPARARSPRPSSTATATTPSGFSTTWSRHGGRVLEIPTVYRFRKGGESKTRFSAYLWTYLALGVPPPAGPAVSHGPAAGRSLPARR